jgi:hypothetical protein
LRKVATLTSGEVAATKEREGEKRIARPPLAHKEGAETRTGEQKRPGHVGKTVFAPLHQPVGERPNPERDEPCPEHIELRVRCLAAGDFSVRDPGEGDRADRQRTFRKKIHRHEAHSTSAPPSGGPPRLTAPVPVAQIPIARPL